MLKIYYARIAPLRDTALFERGKKLLPKERIEKLARNKTEEGRLCSMAAGLLLVYGLKQQNIKAKEITFEKNDAGKPFIPNQNACYFNLSHSGDYAAVAVSEKEVGIDVEIVRTGKQKLVERFFSKEERKELLDSWSDEAFTKIWTRKESYIKAIGMGMRMPLQAFNALEDRIGDYHLKTIRLTDTYFMSICQKENTIDTLPKEVDFKKVIAELEGEYS